jgi:RNA polymerase sigma-70 factor (sigma-E family)
VSKRQQADQAFEDFVRAQWPSLVRLARVLGADHGAAEDLAQVALTKTYARWSSVRDNPSSYVRRALVTSNIDRFRGRQGRDNQVRYDATPPDGGGTPDHSAHVGERDEQLTALRALPPRMRAVIVLRYYEDWSDEQIAEALGCTRATVRSTAARALDKLRPTLCPTPGGN